MDADRKVLPTSMIREVVGGDEGWCRELQVGAGVSPPVLGSRAAGVVAGLAGLLGGARVQALQVGDAPRGPAAQKGHRLELQVLAVGDRVLASVVVVGFIVASIQKDTHLLLACFYPLLSQ